MPISLRPAFPLLCLCLFALGCRSETDRLIAQLGDPDPKVRASAARSLGEASMDASAAVPALVKALDDHEPTVRLSSALAIAEIDPRNERYVPVLTKSLLAGHGPVFVEVGRMGTNAKWALPTLVKLLADQRPAIRALSAQTLGQIGVDDGDVKAALQQRLRDDQPVVRNAAERSLKRLSETIVPSG